ncbi:MAG: LegC family aminotransferase [Candidatus Berkiellales bacterium]
MSTVDHCIAAISHVLGKTDKEIALHEPHFGGNEWNYVKQCIDTGWVSSVGDYVKRFEQKLIQLTDIPYAVAVVNGTAALHISLILSDVQPNDEVLIPSLTFIATANAVTYCGAIPHFVESSSTNLGIDVDKLADYLKNTTTIKNGVLYNKNTQRQIKAIIPVHIYGHPVDMDALQAVGEEYHLSIIEDASESLGSYYKGRHTGCGSDISVLSFNGNKLVTTGGGGGILLNNKQQAERAKHLTTTAKVAHRFEFYHDEVGYNYRMPNINAALGCAQLEQLGEFIIQKRALAHRYSEAFAEVQDISFLKEPEYAISNYWLNAIILKQADKETKLNIIEKAFEHRYMLRGLWTPLDRLPMYQNCPKMALDITNDLFDRVIALPSSPQLGKSYA